MWSLGASAWKPAGVVSRFVRKVRTASGAVAVQVVTRRDRRVEHVGSAHSDAELALLLAAARERWSPGQVSGAKTELDPATIDRGRQLAGLRVRHEPAHREDDRRRGGQRVSRPLAGRTLVPDDPSPTCAPARCSTTGAQPSRRT
jgi:hypothetical protein